jgi:hypothetical protein
MLMFVMCADLCVWHDAGAIVDKKQPIYSFLASSHYRIRRRKIKGVVRLLVFAAPVVFFPYSMHVKF